MTKKDKDAKLDKIADDVYKDVLIFFNSQNNWDGKDGEAVCYGMLSAVLNVMDNLSPNKESLMGIVIASLSNVVTEEDLNNILIGINKDKIKN